jgi:hypothetical protein
MNFDGTFNRRLSHNYALILICPPMATLRQCRGLIFQHILQPKKRSLFNRFAYFLIDYSLKSTAYGPLLKSV